MQGPDGAANHLFSDPSHNPARRGFLRNCSGALLLASGLLPFATASASTRRFISLVNTHTSERLELCYFRDGKFVADACQRLDYLLRDFRSGDVHNIDPKLYDVVHAIQTEVGHRGQVEIISGYRSPATNAKLRSSSTGVAKRSLHMQGQALDIRLRGVDSAKVRDAALALRAGGVGYYKKSDFVHVDTGRVRHW
ncbi:MAG: DUF882 domain-containing protein [Thiogranum sp.]|jgi:uncharacterized protein YcbK (DUF882 family)|nr:DUF882 domain-containing protein [Thiogranum sp.]